MPSYLLASSLTTIVKSPLWRTFNDPFLKKGVEFHHFKLKMKFILLNP